MDKISIVGNLSLPVPHEFHEHKSTLHLTSFKKTQLYRN